MVNQRIRIKLKSFDYNLVDKSAEKIVKTVKSTGAVVSGPIPLPTKKKIYTVLRSPHVNKKAREQFQLCSYKRILDIYSSTAKTVDALMKLELPSGVDVEIKVVPFGSYQTTVPKYSAVERIDVSGSAHVTGTVSPKML